MSARTPEQIEQELISLRQLMQSLPERKDNRPVEAQIEALEWHRQHGMTERHLDFIGGVLYMFGMVPECPDCERHEQHEGVAYFKEKHPWYDTPSSGCDCAHCEPVREAVKAVCVWFKGSGEETPTQYSVRAKHLREHPEEKAA